MKQIWQEAENIAQSPQDINKHVAQTPVNWEDSEKLSLMWQGDFFTLYFFI